MKALTQTKQNQYNRLALALPEYVGNKQRQNWQPTIHNRLIHATEYQALQKQSNKAHKGLTEYANWLIENKYSDLANLLYDYTGSRMVLTGIKHDVLMKVRASKSGNVKGLLRASMVKAIEGFIKAGALRKSDASILSGKYPNKTKY